MPAIQLYTGDWLKDPVAGCSLAAQGLWLRMMFIAHDSRRYGYLANLDGSAIPPESIARRCGCTLEQYETLLGELDGVGVPSRTTDGILFSRRMVRDAVKRRKAAKRQAEYERQRAEKREKSESAVVELHSRKGDLATTDALLTPILRPSSSSSSSSYLDKKGEKKENIKRKKTAYPENFKVPDSVVEWSAKNGLPDPACEIDAFRDYHLSKGTMFLDWPAAFRNWLRISKRFAANGKTRFERELDARREQTQRMLLRGVT